MSHQILRPVAGTALAFAVLLSAPAAGAWNVQGGPWLDTRMHHSQPYFPVRSRALPRHFRNKFGGRRLHRRLQQRYGPAIVPLPYGPILLHRPIGKSRRHHRSHRHHRLDPRHNSRTVIILGGSGISYSFISRH